MILADRLIFNVVLPFCPVMRKHFTKYVRQVTAFPHPSCYSLLAHDRINLSPTMGEDIFLKTLWCLRVLVRVMDVFGTAPACAVNLVTLDNVLHYSSYVVSVPRAAEWQSNWGGDFPALHPFILCFINININCLSKKSIFPKTILQSVFSSGGWGQKLLCSSYCSILMNRGSILKNSIQWITGIVPVLLQTIRNDQ